MIERFPNEISRELLDSITECKLVGIHGATGSGKSSLAKEIMRRIGRGTHIEIDDFLSSDRKKPYLDRVKTDDLLNRMLEAAPPIFLDCLIVLDVLEKINREPDLLLYCERVHSPMMLIGPRELNALFASYKAQHLPEATAKQVFTLSIEF